jgi:opacity protein-like surface antigen
MVISAGIQKRKNKMFRKISIAIFMGILTLQPLVAKSQTNVFLGPHLGIQKSKDADKANYLAGITLRAKLSPIIGLEGDVGYRQQKYGNDALTVKEWPVTITALIYPAPVLYGGIGAGWYNTTFDYADRFNQAGIDDETTQKFGWHLAAGIEVPASPQMSVFGDIRYVFLKYKIKELPGAVLDGAKADFYSINIGLLFRL